MDVTVIITVIRSSVAKVPIFTIALRPATAAGCAYNAHSPLRESSGISPVLFVCLSKDRNVGNEGS